MLQAPMVVKIKRYSSRHIDIFDRLRMFLSGLMSRSLGVLFLFSQAFSNLAMCLSAVSGSGTTEAERL